jgi:ribosomal protein S18 acetylase RimI-like enzyme
MTSIIDEPGVEIVKVRAMREDDIDAIVRIDAIASGRPRPRYFELMVARETRSTALQMSLVAESDGRVIGFVVASLYYGEYGMTEPTASMEAIGVEPSARRQRVAHALLLQLTRNVAAIGATSIRTEVEWSDFDLLAFLQSERFAPAPRLCLERKVDSSG